jgi:L-threonate 2-dehydrogenase
LLSKFETGIPDMYPKAYRWVAEMREIATFLGEDRAAAMIFEGAARLYDRLAIDIANEGKERGSLDGFFQSGPTH